jgi:cellulose synthase/poly-beta-1,6-N-acetylglucosamine synthase-like glycosyltransferase
MRLIEWLFWLFAFIIFYSYIGYGLLLWLLIKFRSLFKKTNNKKKDFFYPHVSLVIPAFNEEDFIREKIDNTLSLDYPADKLQIIFSTDGSNDRTPEIIKEYARFHLMHNSERKGKIAAMNRAMKTITNPYVIFCDANTLVNKDAVKEIVRHYQDSKVGAVSGEKKVMSQADNNTAGKGESLYWKYESSLKKLDSEFYTVVGAAGELFSFRTDLFEEVEEDTLLDDFMISLRICQKGYRVIYEPRAFAMEKPSSNLKEEQKRKVRISAGAFQSMWRLKKLLNPFPHPALSFQYISHRVLRWALCPFLLPIIFILNIVIVLEKNNDYLYVLILILQITFYIMAIIGWYMSKSGRSARLLNFPYYFVFMNISLYMGLKKFLSGGQSVLWEKAKRNA